MGTRVGLSAARHAAAGALALLLAACVPPLPRYAQTAGSAAAFALAEAIRGGEQGDLPGRARGAGLVEAGVCHEVGSRRLYCNALRLSDLQFVGSPVGSEFAYRYEELRLCLVPGRAVGFLAGSTDGAIPVPLYREYPEEFASILGSPGVEVQPEPRFAEEAALIPSASVTDLPVASAVRRLGYGGPGSRFEDAGAGVLLAIQYPGHAPGRRACRGL